LTIAILVLGFVTSLVEVWKDWNERGVRKRRFRWWKLSLTVLGFPIAVLLVWHTYQDASKTESDNKVQIQRLQSAVETQIRNNDTQYERNQTELHNIGGQLIELKTQVATEELRKKITALQDQLAKSLAPAPRALLTFSFYPVGVAADVAVTDVTLPVAPDGSVHVDFIIMNLTSVDALEGDVNLQICDDCKFVKPPDGFSRLAGQSEREMNWPFQHILAKSMVAEKSVDILAPPAKYGTFLMGINYRCRTCVIDTKPSLGLVRLRRDTVQLPHR
jgi:hypothetical protein